jgi:hypothetical protein
MTKIKKKYQRPALELIPTEPFYLLEGSKKTSGYAIDNDNADPGLIIPIKEETEEDEDDDGFVEID